jgi:hypothetical protein
MFGYFIRCTWKIINEVKGKEKRDRGIHSIVTDNKVVMNQNRIAEAFNKYFLSIADSAISDINRHTSTSITNPITYLADVFKRPFTKMSWQYATTHEIGKIIKSPKTKDSSGYDEIL